MLYIVDLRMNEGKFSRRVKKLVRADNEDQAGLFALASGDEVWSFVSLEVASLESLEQVMSGQFVPPATLWDTYVEN